jgi:hypothetical protein
MDGELSATVGYRFVCMTRNEHVRSCGWVRYVCGGLSVSEHVLIRERVSGWIDWWSK